MGILCHGGGVDAVLEGKRVAGAGGGHAAAGTTLGDEVGVHVGDLGGGRVEADALAVGAVRVHVALGEDVELFLVGVLVGERAGGASAAIGERADLGEVVRVEDLDGDVAATHVGGRVVLASGREALALEKEVRAGGVQAGVAVEAPAFTREGLGLAAAPGLALDAEELAPVVVEGDGVQLALEGGRFPAVEHREVGVRRGEGLPLLGRLDGRRLFGSVATRADIATDAGRQRGGAGAGRGEPGGPVDVTPVGARHGRQLGAVPLREAVPDAGDRLVGRREADDAREHGVALVLLGSGAPRAEEEVGVFGMLLAPAELLIL